METSFRSGDKLITITQDDVYVIWKEVGELMWDESEMTYGGCVIIQRKQTCLEITDREWIDDL